VHHTFRTERSTNLKLGKTARSCDASDRYRERNVLETPKLVGRLPTIRAIKGTSFKVKGHRSWSPCRLTLRPEVRHIFRTNGKAYELLSWYTDGARRPVSPTSGYLQGKRSMSQGHVVCLISRERKVRETPKLVGKLPTPRAQTRTTFEVKKSKVKVTRLINDETESVLPMNFKLGRRLEHALSTVMASYGL